MQVKDLTPQQRKLAERKIAELQKKNPLRRIKVDCCVGWRRDPLAVQGDWVWCDNHAKNSRVVAVEE